MSESVQTSVEQINLLAAQLRYKIDSALQLNAHHRHPVHLVREDVPRDNVSGALLEDIQPCSRDIISAAAVLENDYLHREILDLKQAVDKLSQQVRTKDSALKSLRDELKQEKISADIVHREHRQMSADAKANERYVKCVQTEYDLLRNMTTKSQEAFLVIGGESLRHAAEFDKTSKMVKKQTKEILDKNVEIKMLQEDMARLHTDITNQRAAAGTNLNYLKSAQLELEKTSEKEKRLVDRIASLTDRVDSERHLNKILTQTLEETDAKAQGALEGIQLASQQQADLITRLNKVNSEIVSLKAHLNEPPPPAPIITHSNVNNNSLNNNISNSISNHTNSEGIANSYAKSGKSASNSDNEEASVTASSTHSITNTNNNTNSSNGSSGKIPAAAHLNTPYTPYTSGDINPNTTSVPPVCGISEKAPGEGLKEGPRDCPKEGLNLGNNLGPNLGLNQGPNVGLNQGLRETAVRNELQHESTEEEANRTDITYWKESASEGVSHDGQGDSAGVDRDIELKRKRVEGRTDGRNGGRNEPPQDREREREGESEGNAFRAQKIRLGGREGSSNRRMDLTRAIEVMRPVESPVSVAKAALPSKMDELELDDDRCQICHDSPFGLMVLCAVCRRALHSACARKGGGMLAGKDFKCPQC